MQARDLTQKLALTSRLWLRHWRRLLIWRGKLRVSEEAFHLLLAAGVGVAGGLVNLAFYYGIEWVKLVLVHNPDDPVVVAEHLGFWARLAVPALGGLAAGLILHFGLRLVGPQGTTNLLEAVVAGDGRLPFRTALVKALSSLVSIGSGASIGREGGITQFTATLASKWGQFSGWEPYRLRLLVGCGAAAGMAAAYNAPISGAVFAAVVVLGNFSMNLFAPLVVASVVAAVVSRSFFGIRPWYEVPGFDFTRLSELPWFIVLGLASGGLGAMFLKLLRATEGWFQRLDAPLWVKVAAGGLLVGLIATEQPEVWGNGYVVTNRILGDWYGAGLGALILVGSVFLAKLLATAVAFGCGTVGGLFTPTLFVGAALGSLFGHGLHLLGCAAELPTAAFALVGMGSVLAATTHSPLLAMIMVFEISLRYSLMPPLMLGCAVAVLAAKRLHPESVYTEPLRWKRLVLERETASPGAALERTVGDVMRAPVPPLTPTARLSEIGMRFVSSPNNFLPVVDEGSRLVGLVALQDMKPYLNENTDFGVIAQDIMRAAPRCLTPSQPLAEALPVVLASEQRNIPVVNSAAEMRLVGSVVRAEVLGLLSEAISPKGEGEETNRFL